MVSFTDQFIATELFIINDRKKNSEIIKRKRFQIQ